jgi:uncharacterized membrane protein YhaH (DUF805 family)
MPKQDREYWLDRGENVTRLYRGLWIVALALFAADFLVRRHEDLTFAEWLGFYAVYGFVACVALVLTAKAMRRALKRPEDYYDDR